MLPVRCLLEGESQRAAGFTSASKPLTSCKSPGDSVLALAPSRLFESGLRLPGVPHEAVMKVQWTCGL